MKHQQTQQEDSKLIYSMRFELILLILFGYLIVIALEVNLSIALPVMAISIIQEEEERLFSVYSNGTQFSSDLTIPKECIYRVGKKLIQNKVSHWIFYVLKNCTNTAAHLGFGVWGGDRVKPPGAGEF